jgi:hypothetical protein
MKRAILLGFATCLLMGAIGSLTIHKSDPVGVILLLGAIGVPVVIVAMRTPPSESWAVAIRGWLIGYLALPIAVVAVIVAAYLLAQLDAVLRRSWRPAAGAPTFAAELVRR